ncbi:MAG: hypothetical protein OXC95_04180 [Dehalococcoidia bacterium]|nr:hypothetical protein [Dehalococcoidia bacterium]
MSRSNRREESLHAQGTRVLRYPLPTAAVGDRRWQGLTFDGCVKYADGTEKRIEAAAITAEFRESVSTFMRRIVSRKPDRHVPSERECGWCEVSSEDCSERIEPGMA